FTKNAMYHVPSMRVYFVASLFVATPLPWLYTLSLHDALPISSSPAGSSGVCSDSSSAPSSDSSSPGTSSPLRLVSPEPVSSSPRSEEHTSELQSRENLVCRLLLEKKKKLRN